MNKEAIGIIGASYQAMETASYLRSRGLEIGFFADELASGEQIHEREGIRHINISDMPRDVKVITAVGDNDLRKHLVGEQERSFINCIMPNLEDSVTIGEDVTIAPGCTLTTYITIGSHVLINIGCNISHDNVIDDYVTISPGVNIAGKCHIGEGTFIGIGASIIDRVHIGRGCVIAAGAVVLKDVPDGSTVAGVPARPVEK